MKREPYARIVPRKGVLDAFRVRHTGMHADAYAERFLFRPIEFLYRRFLPAVRCGASQES